MAVDMFLKLDGIAGESAQKGHKDEIEVLSFSWGVSHAAPAVLHGGHGRAGRAEPSDLSFLMRTSKASPTLMLACATGKHLKQGIFVIEKAGETPFPFYTLTLTDVLVSSFQASGSDGGDFPVESISLAFRTLRLKEVAQSPKGTPGDTVETAFDFGRNRRL
jgi:type VI secretion system secreted protein Hcp